jgi:thiol-disulfide isomerase/thioredoxin
VSAPAPAPRRFPGALLGAGLVALCAAGGFFAYHATRPERALVYPDPAVPPPGASAGPSPAATRKIPEDLPAIVLPALSGAPTTLQTFRGKLLVVNFWATWCEPCRREIPLLQRLQHEHAKDGIEVVGIAVDHREDVARYAAQQHIAYPLLVGEQGGLEMVNALGMDTVLPFSVFADRSGRIVTLKIGELHRDEAEFILARMTDLDQGRMDLAAAREQIAAGIARLNAARDPTARSGPD